MPSEVEPLLHTCPKCGALLDVSEQEPFSEINCPSCDTSMRVRTRFDHFELVEFVASGGMGSVYKARDLNLNRIIALKLLRKEFSADAGYIEKLETEAKITASVTHPNVVQVFSFGCDQGVYYIAMELVDKGSLDDLMNLQQRIAEAQVLEIGSQVAQGLRAAYQAGLIHRDVKPGNILFADAHTAKIVDFGLAMPLEQAQEGEEDIWGTPYYVAPEKLNHEPEDFRSDIYSLGGTLFHALAGRPPFEAENASLVALKHLKSQVVSLQAFAPDISSPTAYVINRTLAKNPEDRYQSYDELIEHLEYARTQLLENAGSARQPKTRVVMEDEKQQNVLGYIMIGMLAFTLVIGLVLYLFRDSILSRNTSVEELARQQMERSATSGEQALAAVRKEIVQGNLDEAFKLLKPLEARPSLTEPLKTSIALHECVGRLIAGEFWQASGFVARFENDAPGRSVAIEDDQRRQFINALRSILATRENALFMAPSGSAESFQPAGCLIVGLKEWDASRFAIADNLFEQFLESKPKGNWSWLEDFRPLIAQYHDDYQSFRALDDQIKAAKTAADRTAIASQIPGVKAKLKRPGRLPEALAVYEKSMHPEMQPADFGSSGEVPFPVLYARVMKTLGEMMPGAARQLINDTKVAGGDAPKEALLRKVGLIDEFKKSLIGELPRSVVGQRWVALRSGPWIFGTVTQASETEITLRVDGREIPVAWSDVTPSTLLVWADSGGDPSKLWFSGVYASVAGYSKEGLVRLKQGADLRPEHRADLSIFETAR